MSKAKKTQWLSQCGYRAYVKEIKTLHGNAKVWKSYRISSLIIFIFISFLSSLSLSLSLTCCEQHFYLVNFVVKQIFSFFLFDFIAFRDFYVGSTFVEVREWVELLMIKPMANVMYQMKGKYLWELLIAFKSIII